MQFSDDGRKWQTVRRVTDGGGGRATLLLTESETRYLRLALHDGPKRAYAISEIDVKDLAFGATPNAFFEALARDSPRGYFPRGFSDEQGAWTLVGVDGGSDTGLLSEDGALEIGKGGFTIEPFVVERGKAVTWADVDPRPFLVDDDLPMPGVQWTTSRWSLRITTFATGTPGDMRLVARYDLANLTDQPLSLTLALAARPFQVNPPAQFLNTVGGASPIRDLAWDGGTLTVNGTRPVYPLSAPARVALQPFDAGPLVSSLATARRRSAARRSRRIRLRLGRAVLSGEARAAGEHDVRRRRAADRECGAAGSRGTRARAVARARAGARRRDMAREARSRDASRAAGGASRSPTRCTRRSRTSSSPATGRCCVREPARTHAPGSATAR